MRSSLSGKTPDPFDPDPKSLTWTYDADGRVATAGDDGSSFTMTYNSGGYLSQLVATIGSGFSAPTVAFTYYHDPFGNYLGFHDAGYNSVSYTFDAADRLTSAALTASSTTATESFTYGNPRPPAGPVGAAA